MTVESATNKSGPYIASGATGVFPRNFLVFHGSHVRVVRTRGEEQTDITTGIAHSGLGNPTGTVTLSAGIQAGDRITLLRNVPNVQRSDYSVQSSVPTDQVELDLDLLAMQVQDLAERQERALTLPVDSLATGEEAMAAALAAPRYAMDARKAAERAEDAANSRINPMMFGAVGDGVTDDTAALNRMFDYARSTIEAAALFRPVAIDGRGRTYCTFGSVNATLLQNNKGLSIRDFFITSRASGKVAVDFSGSRWFALENFHVWGQGQTDASRRPWSGLLLMRADDARPGSNFTLRNVTVDGYFKGTALHNYAAEMVHAESCYFWNRLAPNGEWDQSAPNYEPAYGAVIDGRGTFPHKSDYVAGTTGRQSSTMNTYVACSFQKPFGVQGPALYFSDFASTAFLKPYITNGGPGAAIEWRLWSTFTPYSVTFDGLQIETDGNKSVFNFTTGGVAVGFPIHGLSVTLGNVFSTDDIFRTDAVAGSLVRLRDLNLKVNRYNSTPPARGVFHPRARFAVGGQITVPSSSDLGVMSEYNDFTAIVVDFEANRRDFWGRTYHRGGAQIYGNLGTSGLPVHADNAAAKAAGLANGDLYRTAAGDLKAVVP